MGFFSSCWEALLQVSAYAETLGTRYHSAQEPLRLPIHGYHEASNTAANGVSFEVPGTGFT